MSHGGRGRSHPIGPPQSGHAHPTLPSPRLARFHRVTLLVSDPFDWDPDAPESPLSSEATLARNPFTAPSQVTSPRATTFTPSLPQGGSGTIAMPPLRGAVVPPRVTTPARGAPPPRGQVPPRLSAPIPIPGNHMKRSTSDDNIAESPPISIPSPIASNAPFPRPPGFAPTPSQGGTEREECAMPLLDYSHSFVLATPSSLSVASCAASALVVSLYSPFLQTYTAHRASSAKEQDLWK